MMRKFPIAKLTDIKFRIEQLDGGTFQTLCDVYFKCRDYGTGYLLDMNPLLDSKMFCYTVEILIRTVE